MFTFNTTLNTLTTDTSDVAKMGIYNLRLRVKYDTYYYGNGKIDFNVTIGDPCANAVLTMKSTILPSFRIEYSIGTDPKYISFNSGKV